MRFRTEQPPYSLPARGVEADVLPVARRLGMGALTCSPLASGFLSGRYRKGRPIDDTVVSLVPRARPRRPVGPRCQPCTTATASRHTSVTHAQRAQVERAGAALVVIDPIGLRGNGVPSVGATNWDDGLAATEHPLELGRRRAERSAR